MDVPSKPPHHANNSATLFCNPWCQSGSFLASGQILTQFPLAWARSDDCNGLRATAVVKPDFGAQIPDEGVLKATWLGHAGFMVQLPLCSSGRGEPIRILFDPIWSDTASPIKMMGLKRRLPPPCSLQDLPEFHFVVTSHNHYDHLDLPTIEAINKLRGPQVQYIAPLGNKTWFLSAGIPSTQITELDWWDELELGTPSSNIKLVCTPAQHNSGRGFLDQRVTLWASWVVQLTTDDATVSVYHAGDTGYMTETGPCPVFKEIGERYGPFDLAMIPIWRGGTLSFVASMGLRLVSTDILDGLHASPAHALALHKDICSRHSLGMHFATFAGSDAEAQEPLVELRDARENEGVGKWEEEGGFSTVDVGATVNIPISQAAKTRVVPMVSPALT